MSSIGTGRAQVTSDRSGSGGAPAGAEYIVGVADATLTAERVVTNSPTVLWDLLTAGQAKVHVAVDSISNALLAVMPANSVKARVGGSADNPEDVALPAQSVLARADVDITALSAAVDTVLGRATGFAGDNLVFQQLRRSQIETDAVSFDKMQNILGVSVIGKASTASGDPEHILAAANTLLGRSGSGNVGFLTQAQATALLDIFTDLLKGLVPASGGGTTNFLRADGLWAAPPAGGGSANKGEAILDFGAFPGSPEAFVDVAGQATIVAGSVVHVQIKPLATPDHSADEHLIERIKIAPGAIVAATGFRVHGYCDDSPAWRDVNFKKGAGNAQGGPAMFAQSQRLWGRWTVGWTWS